MTQVNVSKVGVLTMTAVASRPVHHAKTVTFRLWALNAMSIVMEPLPIILPVLVLIIE